mmetsp:Transcript_91950/g.295708  ORF Transcript_91950/g.295708 Transcript_91950/m.295708 type:complete len:292 (-) Transcript_91950:135-1010(-)
MVGAACVRPPLLLLRPLLLQRQAVARRSSRAYARHRLRHDARRPRAQRCGLGGRLLRLLAGGRRQRLAGRREAVRPRGLRGGRVVVEAEACEVVVRVLLDEAVPLLLGHGPLPGAKEVDSLQVGVLLVHRRRRRLRCRQRLLSRRRNLRRRRRGLRCRCRGRLRRRHAVDHGRVVRGALRRLPAQPVLARGRRGGVGVGQVRLRLLARLLGDLREGLDTTRRIVFGLLLPGWRRREGGARVPGVEEAQRALRQQGLDNGVGVRIHRLQLCQLIRRRLVSAKPHRRLGGRGC